MVEMAGGELSADMEAEAAETPSTAAHAYDKVAMLRLSAPSDVRVYDKITMLRLSSAPQSTRKPDYLETSFFNDVGLWCPELWIQDVWNNEGVDSRGAMRRRQLERLKVSHPCLAAPGSDIVLSPQRRSFTTGCKGRSQSPAPAAEVATDVLAGGDAGAAAAAGGVFRSVSDRDRNWRSGTNRAQLRRELPSNRGQTVWSRNEVTSWQNGRGGGMNGAQPAWRRGPAGDMLYRNYGGSGRRPSQSYAVDQQLPEWMEDGPESMTDTIELRGFDDAEPAPPPFVAQHDDAGDAFSKGAQAAARKRSRHRNGKAAVGSAGSRPSSSRSGARSRTPEATGEPVVFGDKVPLASDLDFAAMFGLSGDAASTLMLPPPNSDAAVAASEGGSRFSRFFGNQPPNTFPVSDTNNNSDKGGKRTTMTSSSGAKTAATNSLLQQLMSDGAQGPYSRQQDVALPQGALSVEELEQRILRENYARRAAAEMAGAPFAAPHAQRPETFAADEQHRLLMQSLLNQPPAPLSQQQQQPPPFVNDRRPMASSQQQRLGNPLQDPNQQAQLVDALHQFQIRQQLLTSTDFRRSPSPQMVQQQQQQFAADGANAFNPAVLAQIAAAMQANGRLPAPPTRPPVTAAQSGYRPFAGMPPHAGVPPDAYRHPGVQMMLMQMMQQAAAAQPTARGPSPPAASASFAAPSAAGNSRSSELRATAASFMPTSVMKQMACKPTEHDFSKLPDSAGEAFGMRPVVKQGSQHSSASPITVKPQSTPAEHLLRAQQQQAYATAVAMSMLPPHARMPTPGGMAPAVPMHPQLGVMPPQFPANPYGHAMQQAFRAQMLQGLASMRANDAMRQRMAWMQQMGSGGGAADGWQNGGAPTPPDSLPQNAVLAKLLASVGADMNAAPSSERPPAIVRQLPPDAQPISVEELEKRLTFDKSR